MIVEKLILIPPSEKALKPGMARARRTRASREAAIDQTLMDSFPASDPPSWTSSRIGGDARPDEPEED